MKVDELRTVVHASVEDGVPGAALSIVDRGQRTDVVAGVEDTEGAPLTTSSIGRYYSSAKAVTSVVVLQLVETGDLELNLPISEILPEWAAVNPAPTVRDLLTHTAGLTYQSDPAVGDADAVDAAYFAAGIDHEGSLSLAEFSSRHAAQELCFELHRTSRSNSAGLVFPAGRSVWDPVNLAIVIDGVSYYDGDRIEVTRLPRPEFLDYFNPMEREQCGINNHVVVSMGRLE